MVGTDEGEFFFGDAGADEILGKGGGDDVVAGGGSDDTLSGGAGADTFLFRQDNVGSPPDTDVVLDWDADDAIVVCGRAAGFFSVRKIEIGVFDDLHNLVKDVVIGLSNGQFIRIVDAGDSGDRVADDIDPEAASAGNFIRFGPDGEECRITCDIEWPD
jgi:Ca2+-binding RTX toxin-like protein